MKVEDRRMIAGLIGAVVGFLAMRKWYGVAIGSVLALIIDEKLKAKNRPAPAGPDTRAPRSETTRAAEPDVRTDHDVLGVAHDADVDAVKARFRDLAKKYHPDHFQNASPQFKDAAESEFKRIREAYERILTRAGVTP